MTRTLGKLNALAVNRARARGYLSDGGGLYLQISPSGSKSWVFRFRKNGRLREMGLGAAHTVSLAEARERAANCRKLRSLDMDPIEDRESKIAKAKLEAAKSMTFRQCANEYIAAHKPSWKNDRHTAQWSSSLEMYAYPTIGDLPVQSIDVSLIRKVLDPIWQAKTETASRVRGRIETILDWATVAGHRTGANPARWRGHLDKMLPRRAKLQKPKHHPALSYAEISTFISALRQQEAVAAKALEFLILTAARTGEVIGATWKEIDLDARMWTIPGERMKADKEHRIPLSKPALCVLRTLRDLNSSREGFVFPGLKPYAPLQHEAMLTLLKRMHRTDLTVHGFRSTFRVWAGECTSYPRELAEEALAHSLPDKVEAAYRRTDLFDKRHQLMADWATYCERPVGGGEVIPIRSVAAGANASR